jgi:hypothetical protein
MASLNERWQNSMRSKRRDSREARQQAIPLFKETSGNPGSDPGRIRRFLPMISRAAGPDNSAYDCAKLTSSFAAVNARRVRHTTNGPRNVRGSVTVEAVELYQARESSDKPILKAFCRVAPSVRFNVRAMLAARVFFLAAAFNVRTSDAVHARRFDFLAIQTSPKFKREAVLVHEIN